MKRAALGFGVQVAEAVLHRQRIGMGEVLASEEIFFPLHIADQTAVLPHVEIAHNDIRNVSLAVICDVLVQQ